MDQLRRTLLPAFPSPVEARLSLSFLAKNSKSVFTRLSFFGRSRHQPFPSFPTQEEQYKPTLPAFQFAPLASCLDQKSLLPTFGPNMSPKTAKTLPVKQSDRMIRDKYREDNPQCERYIPSDSSFFQALSEAYDSNASEDTIKALALREVAKSWVDPSLKVELFTPSQNSQQYSA